jgi:hypothetical protein
LNWIFLTQVSVQRHIFLDMIVKHQVTWKNSKFFDLTWL